MTSDLRLSAETDAEPCAGTGTTSRRHRIDLRLSLQTNAPPAVIETRILIHFGRHPPAGTGSAPRPDLNETGNRFG